MRRGAGDRSRASLDNAPRWENPSGPHRTHGAKRLLRVRTGQKPFKASTAHSHHPPSAGSFRLRLKELHLNLEKKVTLLPSSSRNQDLARAIIKAQVTLPITGGQLSMGPWFPFFSQEPDTKSPSWKITVTPVICVPVSEC